jgi:hypothetical protein
VRAPLMRSYFTRGRSARQPHPGCGVTPRVTLPPATARHTARHTCTAIRVAGWRSKAERRPAKRSRLTSATHAAQRTWGPSHGPCVSHNNVVFYADWLERKGQPASRRRRSGCDGQSGKREGRVRGACRQGREGQGNARKGRGQRPPYPREPKPLVWRRSPERRNVTCS